MADPSDSAEPSRRDSSIHDTPALSAAAEHYHNRPFRDYRSTSTLSVPDMKNESQILRVLIAANCQRDFAQAETLVVRFSKHPKIETRAICDHVTTRISQVAVAFENKSLEIDERDNQYEKASKEMLIKTAYHLCEWADLLVLAPIDANTISKMLHGMTGNLLLEVLRSWDVSKKIIMVPGMTNQMWENPMTKKQLNKIRRKWSWVRVMAPVLWSYDDRIPSRHHISYDGIPDLVEVINNQAELMTIGHDVDIATSGHLDSKRTTKMDKVLPPEIWTIVFEHLGDWETAMSLGIYTTLPRPKDWVGTENRSELQSYMRELEWTILTKPVRHIITKLEGAPSSMTHLSSLCVKLIIKFGLVELLAYLEDHFRDVFWTSFGGKLLPTKASAVYSRPEVLEWWRTSKSFLKKEYTNEAVDGASKSGFIHVLDWWRKSGLPLKYTEVALEQASSKGHILVLEWWKQASIHQGHLNIETDSSKHSISATRHRQNIGEHTELDSTSPSETTSHSDTIHYPVETETLRLKVGKSIIAAAQNGQAATIRWWDTSGIPYSHSEAVAKIASTYGHINVLETWKDLKGEKFATSFDNQVLVNPTKNGFVKVLEWWKNQTLETIEGPGGNTTRIRVEYKTCDIEEALEDSVGNSDEVKRWWARNGLNLGVGTSEWMKVKVL
jgi:hypothetical protein